MKLEFSHEEIDALCLSLQESSVKHEGDEKISLVFETLRQKIRKKVPNNLSMQKLVEELQGC